MTAAISKQLLPVYDKPMIYYPLATLMLADIREILIIVTPEQAHNFRILLGDGSQLGIKLDFVVQEKPNGIPQAFLLGEDFIAGERVCLILGDNIFHGPTLGRSLAETAKKSGATIFAYEVEDPTAYGVVEFSESKAIGIEEKPLSPKSRYAIPGLYFVGPEVSKRARKLQPSPRGETEIIDLLRTYLDEDQLHVIKLPRGTVWLDSGTPRGLHDASTYVRVIEERQGLKLACLEEISYLQGWITAGELLQIARKMGKSDYTDYLRKLIS
jgi:glucose-1-phosphate thymidylyltransferase